MYSLKSKSSASPATYAKHHISLEHQGQLCHKVKKPLHNPKQKYNSPKNNSIHFFNYELNK